MHKYKGLKIIQEYFYYKEQPARFLKAQIIMGHCTLEGDQIVELYDYGIIDYIVFNRPEETYYFGEKMQIIIGNITTLETVQAQFYSIPPKSYGLTKKPARHEIFFVPIREARHPLNPPKDTQFIDDMDFYLFLETEERRRFEPLWYNFNLMTKESTLQIWAQSNWKIRIPFSSQGRRITHEDIIENDPTQRQPTAYPLIDYDVTTSEELN